MFLFGESKIGERGNRGYVVEGHLDCLKLWQAGYRSVVATLGSAPGRSQIERMVYFFSEVVVVGDGDKAGRHMNAEVKAMIADRIPVRAVELPEGRDPGDLTREEMRVLIGEPESIELTNAR